MKKKKLLSPFVKDMIYISIYGVILYFLYFNTYVHNLLIDGDGIMFYLRFKLFVLRAVTIIFFIFKLSLIHSWRLDKSLNIKYRITEKEGWFDSKRYEVRVLRTSFLFFFYWQQIDYKYTTYKSENIFGAKTIEGYSSEKYYNSIEEAKEAIKQHQKQAKKQVKEYFEREEKPYSKIIKV